MSSNYLWLDSENKIRVNADVAFIELYSSVSQNTPINKVSEEICNIVRNKALQIYEQEPSIGSLNNCKGRWNEFSFLYSAHVSILKKTKDMYLIKMGNESSVKFWQIYTIDARKKFENILNNLNNHQIFIRCSTPDFVLVRRRVVEKFIPERTSENFFNDLKNLYQKIINQCEPSDVISFISLKTSNRPDRRYQILYEANITKYVSKYIHSEDFPLRFDVIGNSNESDTEVFKAPLLSSLKKIELENFTQEIITIEYPAIDSDTQISTIVDLDNYWLRFKISN